MEALCKSQIKNLELFVQNNLQKYSAWPETPFTSNAAEAPSPMVSNMVLSGFGHAANSQTIRHNWPKSLEMEVQMIEFQSNNASGWVKFLTMPARRCENGNLVLRGASVAKASYQITPGQDIAIAVFKNDDSYSISLSFKQKTEA